MQQAVVDGRGLADAADERHQPLAQHTEEAVKPLDGDALFELVEHRLVGVPIGLVIERKAPVVVDQLLQTGRKGRKIVGRLGPVPYGVGLGLEAGVGEIFLAGDAGGLVEALLEQLDLPALLGGQLGGAGGEKFEDALQLAAGQQVVDDAAQHSAGFGAAAGALFGGDGGAVIIEYAEGVGVGVTGALDLLQARQGGLKLHSCFFPLIILLGGSAARGRRSRGRPAGSCRK